MAKYKYKTNELGQIRKSKREPIKKSGFAVRYVNGTRMNDPVYFPRKRK